MIASWEGSTAFITGGAQGIGLAVARAVAKEGARVAIVDVDAQALERARDELAALTDVQAHVLDVQDREGFARVADTVEAELGPVTHLFNNAGIAAGSHVSQMTYEKWDRMLGVNLNGVVNGIQTFVPRMIARGAGGYVVNTSSGAGLIPTDAGFLYTTAKYAVVGMSEVLHQELEPFGIGVSVLCPGRVATDIIQNTYGLGTPAADGLDPVAVAALEASAASLQTGVSPDAVAQIVLDAIGRRQLHILTDDSVCEPLVSRTQLICDAVPETTRA